MKPLTPVPMFGHTEGGHNYPQLSERLRCFFITLTQKNLSHKIGGWTVNFNLCHIYRTVLMASCLVRLPQRMNLPLGMEDMLAILKLGSWLPLCYTCSCFWEWAVTRPDGDTANMALSLPLLSGTNVDDSNLAKGRISRTS